MADDTNAGEMPPEFAELFSRALSPDVLKFISGMRQITGYEIPPEKRIPFLNFHDYITNPQPAFITQWREDNKREHLYHRLVNGVLGNVQNAYACILYHYGNLSLIENQAMDFAARNNITKSLGNSTMGLGNSLKWDFEYQAFVMAYRRCLDYLANALSSYFREQCTSFRNFSSWLEKKRPATVAAALIESHARHAAHFDFVMSEGGFPSTRDKIAHYEFLGAGCINISSRGFELFGGGEGVDPFQGESRLSVILGQRMETLEKCLADMIGAFVVAARELDQTTP